MNTVKSLNMIITYLLFLQILLQTHHPLFYQPVYNVQQCNWHYLVVSEDALVFVAESGTMKKENTESMNVETENLCV